ncbi:malectin domain-containing carbohydrate-binding protein [Cytophagaceae bacterium ABcell3]|nr:malectin domain-containing carbohydrate-binding protein [Cytophagaceae bacterium ABcell3]
MKKTYYKATTLLSLFLFAGFFSEKSLAQDNGENDNDNDVYKHVLYRINVGGIEKASEDDYMNWEEDTYDIPSEYVDLSEIDNSTNRTEEDVSMDESVAEGTPVDIFRSERNFDHHHYDAMQYSFEVPEEAEYEVRLFFSENHFEEPEMRMFHVDINGNRVIENLDIYEEAGHLTGIMKSFETGAEDGHITIEFIDVHGGHQPTISGIEIIGMSDDPEVWEVTSVTEELDADITIYPNPFADQVTVKGEGDIETLNITLFDQNGKVIEKQSTQGVQFQAIFNTSSLPAGMYYLQLESETGAVTMRKLIKTN